MSRNYSQPPMAVYDPQGAHGARRRIASPDPYGYDAGYVLPSASQAGGSSESLWTLIDDRMRGRWKWAVIVGLALSVLFGGLGYFSAVPTYQSLGAIRITPRNPGILQDDITLPNYDRTVVAHISMMKTDRVLKHALDDPELSKLEWARQPKALKRLKAGFDAERDREGELIYVAFSDPDPRVAYAANNAIIRAYYDIHGRSGGIDIDETLKKLKDLEATQNRDLDNNIRAQQDIGRRYNTQNLDAHDAGNREAIADIEDRNRRAERLLQRLESRDTSETLAAQPTERELEAFDPTLAELGRAVQLAQRNFDYVDGTFLPGTMQYERHQRELEMAKQRYGEQREVALKDFRERGGLPRGLTDDLEPKSPEELRAEISANQTRLAELRQEQKELVADLQEMQQLRAKESQLREAMVETSRRIRNLTVESDPRSSFISIADEGSMPEEPNEDARRKRAILGLGAGWMASLGLFFVLGTVDRRAFGASQLQASADGRAPACLGVLPDLGESMKDPEASDVASHCVHQIRNQIEAVRDSQGANGSGYVLAVSSPFQGDGKTSIVLALSWSYAAAGFKTLVVDCDLVGRSLTRQLGLTGREGLKEALLNRQLNGSLNRVAVENLSAVPVGVDARFGPENIRRAELQRLLDSVRDQFDIILVDTGPLLGSLESTPVTSVADGVVLSVRRGRSRSKLDECVQRLSMIGSRCVGVILNCAVRADCNRYVSDASLAAAEEDRAARTDVDGGIVRSLPGERNALVQAMQNSVRGRDGSNAGE